MVAVGDKVRFDPLAYVEGFGANSNKGKFITGTVVFVHKRNGWFSVEYGDPKTRTSFKFVDIGELVTICGK